MRIAVITTDSREHFKDYLNPIPYFGTAPEALLAGMAQMCDAVEIHVISCLQKQPISSPEHLAPNTHYHCLHIPKTGWLRTAYSGCVRSVRKKLKSIKPDIVHGQGTERECSISAVLSGFPNVITIHGNMRELSRLQGARPFSFGWLAAGLEDFSLRRTHGVFCNSAYTESLVGPRTRQTWRVSNPVRSEFFQPLPPAPLNPSRRIVNIGLVSPRKRQLEILRLAKKFHERGDKIRIDFIGIARPETRYVSEFLHEIQLGEKAGYASYLGPKNLLEIIAELDSADAFLHFPFEEAFGLVVAESLARGLKFFGARLGGIVDICTGMSGAELYEADDWEGLADGISRWSAETLVRFPENQHLSEARYHPRRIAERHLEIYNEVLGRTSITGRESA